MNLLDFGKTLSFACVVFIVMPLCYNWIKDSKLNVLLKIPILIFFIFLAISFITNGIESLEQNIENVKRAGDYQTQHWQYYFLYLIYLAILFFVLGYVVERIQELYNFINEKFNKKK